MVPLSVCSVTVVSACNQSVDTHAMRERSVHRGARMVPYAGGEHDFMGIMPVKKLGCIWQLAAVRY